MKVRTGFVSNSSSSAFILLVKKDAYIVAFKNFDVAQKAFCTDFYKEDEVFGVLVMKCANTLDLAGDYRDHWDGPSTKEGEDIFEEKYDGDVYDLTETIEDAFPVDAIFHEIIGN